MPRICKMSDYKVPYLILNILLSHIWSLTFYPVVRATTLNLAARAHECREFALKYAPLPYLISDVTSGCCCVHPELGCAWMPRIWKMPDYKVFDLNMLLSHIWSVTSHPAVAASTLNLAAHECREWRTMDLANPRGRTRPNSLGHRVATNIRRQNLREMTWSVLCENQRAVERNKSGYRSWVLKKKKFCWNFFLFCFWSKIAIYLSLGLYTWRPSYKRSLQPSKKNIHHFKRWNLRTVFLFILGHYCPPGSRSGTTTLENLLCNS